MGERSDRSAIVNTLEAALGNALSSMGLLLGVAFWALVWEVVS